MKIVSANTWAVIHLGFSAVVEIDWPPHQKLQKYNMQG